MSYTNGACPPSPSQDMTSSGVNLHSGDVMNVHMTYDGTTLTWTITDPTAGTSFTVRQSSIFHRSWVVRQRMWGSRAARAG